MLSRPTTFHHFLQTELNESQLLGVQGAGPLLIVAGAGSGKTRVITARIAHLLLNQNVEPRQILALTFTNKAAREMRERIHLFVGNNQEVPFIGTFHAYCLRLLKINNHLLDTPFISIMDTDDRDKLLKSLIHKYHLQKQISVKQLASYISQIKNKTRDITDMSQADKLLSELYHTYEQEKHNAKCIDFDDLLLYAVALFKKNESFRTAYQQTIRHVLVDEYQDTNTVQHELLCLISRTNDRTFALDSLCAVGDEDQSIYSWRGATVTNMTNFSQDFPNTQRITIEQNYRSAHCILQVANYLIAHNTQRNKKQLWSEKKGSDRIRSIACASEYQEAEAITQCIKAVRKHHPSYTIAIVYRTHFQSRTLEESLIKHSIRYTIVGGIQFYERKEIKDLLAYLKLMVNPFDRVSFFRIINCPLRGLGAKFEELCHETWAQNPTISFQEILHLIINEQKITGAKQKSLEHFLAIFKECYTSSKPKHALEHIIQATTYMQHLQTTYDEQEARMRKENVNELINAVTHLEQTGLQPVQALLDEITLMQSFDTTDESIDDPVLLMTLHSAKGLEFDIVAITGLEDGILPSSRSFGNPESLEEERRLLYVGITRAKEYLLFTHAQYRHMYGSMNAQRPSPFLKELPSTLSSLNHCYKNNTEMNYYFQQWFSGRTPSIHEQQSKTPLHNTIRPSIHAQNIWKLYQPIVHASFGTGIIKKIEQKNEEKTYLTIAFKSGIKKIDARFVKPV